MTPNMSYSKQISGEEWVGKCNNGMSTASLLEGTHRHVLRYDKQSV